MNVPLFDDWCIRSLMPSDADSIVKYANNRNISINLRDSFPYPYTLHDAQKWLNASQRRRPETNWAIASSTELIGGIGVHILPDVFRHSAELGYWLGEPFWGKGIATAAVRSMTEFVFRNFEMVRLFAGVFEWNPASNRVLEKAGFHLESRMKKSVFKDGRYIDQLIYVLLQEEWQAREVIK